jgi:hypothetical protein
VGERELWKSWANDRESFERAVLADLEKRVSGQISAELMRDPAGRECRSARLDGSYPNTTIVVSYLVHTGSVEESRFPVWHEGYLAGKEVLDPGEHRGTHLDMAH